MRFTEEELRLINEIRHGPILRFGTHSEEIRALFRKIGRENFFAWTGSRWKEDNSLFNDERTYKIRDDFSPEMLKEIESTRNQKLMKETKHETTDNNHAVPADELRSSGRGTD